MPVILDSDSDPESAIHTDTDEAESESFGEEGMLEESDTDTDAEYSYHIEDNDDGDEMDSDEGGDPLSEGSTGDAAENAAHEMNSETSEPDRSSSSSPSTLSTSSLKSSPPPPPPPPPPSSSKCSGIQMVFQQLTTVFVIYLKFAVLAVLIYSVALWYALNFTDLDAELGSKSSADSESTDHSDTCPAGLVA